VRVPPARKRLRCNDPNVSQKRALKNYRKRLNERGVVRFEVLGELQIAIYCERWRGC
jgi:hypothetical protein